MRSPSKTAAPRAAKWTRASKTARTAAEILIATALCSGCEEPPERRAAGDQLAHRPDLRLQSFVVPVTSGVTAPISVELPQDASSMLIEVRADTGFFFIDEFITPTGSELGRSGLFVTREAREVPGLADFLYPNDDTLAPLPGTYRVSFSASADREGLQPLAGGNVTVRVYSVHRPVEESCGINLDFLVDYDAIDEASFTEALGELVSQTDSMFRQVGISVIDSQVQQINLQSSNIDVGSDSVLSVADDVLAQARRMGSARTDSLHIILVRSIAGENASGFNPAGYSMGLPGPYDADRPNAAVLVATDAYASTNADGDVVLDVDGMATSLTHELGHFLGLYHTSELDGSAHDPLSETPQCENLSGCEEPFRTNIMTSSGWLTEIGLDETDRTTFTSGQGRVMRRHPLCVPFEAGAPGETGCGMDCTAPEVCAVLSDGAGGQYEACLPACDPRADQPCEAGECAADVLGTNVCQ